MLKEPSKVEQRYDAVVAVIRDGMSVTEVAAKFGVHRDTVYVWMSRYEAEGLDGLAERSHRPHRSPLQMAAVAEARVLELRRLRQDRTGDDWISRTVSRNGVIVVSNQQFSVGKHRNGRLVDVRVRDEILEVWDGNELIKSVLRTSKGVVRKKRAESHSK